jgi:four helix bundle protein
MAQEIVFSFEKLKVYQKALDIIDQVYDNTNTLPKEEMYGITSQFRRAVVSIALNIAEGAARSKRDFRRFLDVAQGSIFECVSLLTICKRKHFIAEEQCLRLRVSLCELSKMTSGLKSGLGFSDRNES